MWASKKELARGRGGKHGTYCERQIQRGACASKVQLCSRAADC